ncbi:unnamed protein product [Brassica rapa subsp. trilocularis]
MRGRGREEDESESRVPLLESPRTMEENGGGLRKKLWVETKKLWQIVAPAMFTRITTYSTLVITQAFAGHLGDLELAAISIVYNVVVGFNFGLFLGMASALETLCGQAFGAKKYHMLGVYMQRSWIVLFVCCMLLLPTYLFTTPVLKWLGQPDDIAELSGVVSVWVIPLHFAFCLSFPLQRFLQCQLKSHVPAFGAGVGLVVHFLVCWLFVDGLKLGAVGTMATVSISCMVGQHSYSISILRLRWLSTHLDRLLLRSFHRTLGVCQTLRFFRRHALFGKLVLSYINYNDWESSECSNSCRLFVHMHDDKWLGKYDSSCFLRRNRCSCGK